jgi:hypothetical protein
METLNASIFREILILGGFRFAELCRLQRVCKQWREWLIPPMNNARWWNYLLPENVDADQFPKHVMKRLHPTAQPIVYSSGKQLEDVTRKRRQKLYMGISRLHSKVKRKKWALLSTVARELIRQEKVYSCDNPLCYHTCANLVYGPTLPKRRRPTNDLTYCYNFEVKSRFPLKKAGDFVDPTLCIRCTIYEREFHSEFCFFCRTNKSL